MITGMTFGHQFNIALLSNMDAQFKTLKERWLLLLSDKGKIAKLNGIYKSHINFELRFLTPHYFLHISNSIFFFYNVHNCSHIECQMWSFMRDTDITILGDVIKARSCFC